MLLQCTRTCIKIRPPIWPARSPLQLTSSALRDVFCITVIFVAAARAAEEAEERGWKYVNGELFWGLRLIYQCFKGIQNPDISAPAAACVMCLARW